MFIKEYRNSVKTLGYKDIFSVPLPEECKYWEVSGTELYGVKGIEDSDYSKLNGAVVKRLPRGTVAKRRIIDKVTRAYKVDNKGNYIYEDYPVPSGSVVVSSDRRIELPFDRYKEKSKYGYIDFKLSAKGTEYLYALPKSVLYRVNQTALVLSVKNMKNYAGMGYTTWDSGKIFLHIIPYNPNASYVGSKVLKTGYSLNYNADIKYIVDFWQSECIIPNITLCGLQDGNNLVLSPTVVGYDEYVPYEQLSLGEREIYNDTED